MPNQMVNSITIILVRGTTLCDEILEVMYVDIIEGSDYEGD